MSSVRVLLFALFGAAASVAGAQALGQGGSMASGATGPNGRERTTSGGAGWVEAILLSRP